jgi:Kef-type K+ transport system membrane component KefB
VGRLLMPVFFVVSGLAVDLSGLDGRRLVELVLIVVVAVVAKFGGVYLAARLRRLARREAATLGTLMNTRGLTEIVIVLVGYQLGIIDAKLYAMMVVMALVTTAMTGPLLRRLGAAEEPPAPQQDPRPAAEPGTPPHLRAEPDRSSSTRDEARQHGA